MEAGTGLREVASNALHFHARCFMRDAKFRKNCKELLLSLQKQVSTLDVWLNGFEDYEQI